MSGLIDYVKSLLPTYGSPPVDEPCQTCPEKQPPIKLYKIVVEASTRAGEIPLENLSFSVDGADIGPTDATGTSPESPLRSQATAEVKVVYQNDAERLKQETYTLPIDGISVESKSFSPGDATNFIGKVQDVFGSGGDGISGDKDFVDTYSVGGDVTMEDTDNPDIKLMTVTVKMATLSLVVPYHSQQDTSETVTISPATPSRPDGTTASFHEDQICMPTTAKMTVDYWGITAAGGGDLSRQAIMQSSWDAAPSSQQQTSFPCPWQNWAPLRGVIGDIAEASDPGDFTVGQTAGGGDSNSIPSAYADGIVDKLETGVPVMTSTFATAGHVMVVRGAVVKHDDEAEWLILNDPNGTLASEDSVYGDLDISAPVGRNGTPVADPMNVPADVRAVREVLTRLGHYSGGLDDPIDGTSDTDATVVAIKAYQGGRSPDGRVDDGGGTERRMNASIDRRTRSSYSGVENETNAATGVNADRGRHVYYNGMTEATGTGGTRRYRLKSTAFTLVVEPTTAQTDEEVRQRLVPAQ